MSHDVPTRSTQAALDGMLVDPAIRVVSVDVFDTLLLRTTKPEYQRFAEIAAHVARALRNSGSRFSAEQVLAARLTASEIAYRTAERKQGQREPHFGTIMQLMAAILGLTPEQIPVLQKTELRYEGRVLFPNRRLIGHLKKAKQSGKMVIFVSDMYLRGDEIMHLIKERAPDCPIDRGYSSADIGLSKRYEAIFPHIAADLGIPLQAFFHLGDNSISDFEVPMRLGMQALHMPRAALWQKLHGWRHTSFLKRLRRKGLIG